MKNKEDKGRLDESALLKSCICKKCKSFNDCGEVGGYCLPTISGSRLITNEIECLCFKCAVHKEQNFRFKFYCTKNSEEQQSEMG